MKNLLLIFFYKIFQQFQTEALNAASLALKTQQQNLKDYKQQMQDLENSCIDEVLQNSNDATDLAFETLDLCLKNSIDVLNVN